MIDRVALDFVAVVYRPDAADVRRGSDREQTKVDCGRERHTKERLYG
jgi:hypothetical protein